MDNTRLRGKRVGDGKKKGVLLAKLLRSLDRE
jgi:hypothetical protein